MKTMLSQQKMYLPALLALSLALAACGGAPTPDLEATKQAAVAATQVAQPTDTPIPPTNTPVPPTNTSIPPTDTPMPPTDTPTPTHTPVPPTDTPTPTHTPAPPTDTPTPTKTPVAPTDTPAPTNTPVPALPTSTPIPAVSPAEAHAEQGFNYFKEKRWAEAIAEFEEAIRLDPGYGVAYFGLGYSYALGPEDLAKAITALEKYLQLVPGASNRAQVEADIQTMREMLAAQPSIPIPPGKGALVMFNCRGGDTITVDIIPVGILQELAPKTGPDCYQGEPIFLDPGDYVLKAAIAGVPSFGEQGITIAAGDALQFTWY